MGQAAGRWLQDGLAHVEGRALAFSRRIVADRDGNRACGGGIIGWRGALTRGCTSAGEKSGLREDNWLGSSELALKQRVADRQGRQGGRLRDERASQRARWVGL